MSDEKPAVAKKSGIERYILLAVGVIGALTLLINSIGPLRDSWCKNIGVFCTTIPSIIYTFGSGPVDIESGGTRDNNSDECKHHRTTACITPSAPNRRLMVGGAKFVISARSGGVFIDGNPTTSDPIGTSNIGWFFDANNNNQNKICVIVYARTSACETKVFIKGELTGIEEIVK